MLEERVIRGTISKVTMYNLCHGESNCATKGSQRELMNEFEEQTMILGSRIFDSKSTFNLRQARFVPSDEAVSRLSRFLHLSRGIGGGEISELKTLTYGTN